MSSQSDDFARMIELLEKILEAVTPPPAFPQVSPDEPASPGCLVCGLLHMSNYCCSRTDCPSFVSATCRCGGMGVCNCGVAE